jgi:ATP-dependent exoDNAse (exonuclease V) beta subunit
MTGNPHALPSRRSSSKKPEIALSYTALSELERCGYRHYLERILHLPPRQGDGPGGRLRGRILHRLLQDLDFARPCVEESALARAAAEFGASLDRRELREITGLIAGLAGSDLAARIAAAPRVHCEHPFAFSSPEPITGVFDLPAPNTGVFDLSVPITGIFDLLVPGEECLVVDYKSDAVEPGEDLPALVREHYGAQRLIYALAALHHGARRVEVVHWFLARPHEPVAARFSEHNLAALEAELDTRVADVRRRGFSVSPTPHRELCLTCPGRGTLCSWHDAATLRPHAALPS